MLVRMCSGCDLYGGASGGGCMERVVRVVARRGERPPPLSLSVGTVLVVSAEASPHQPWQALTSSDDSVLECESWPGSQGSLEARCVALRPGEASVATVTSAFAGDPYGPQQFRWLLKVTVC